ncbi:MAG TPA: fumarylacetoacetate hydrolase family protein [Ktedonobacterales bacterium]|nr:fumarylacetoacetate hydrolase family protein [Ktedonobacterales bacterium]
MRIATFRDDAGRARLGVARDGELVDLMRAATALNAPEAREAPALLTDMLALIAAGPQALDRIRDLARLAPEDATIPLAIVRLLAPIPRPSKNIFCVGRNYAEHAAESLRASGDKAPAGPPQFPNIFTKAVTSVIGPTDNIPYDADLSDELDWEVELGVIVGEGGRTIAREDALAHVFGYTVINDISARDLQHRGGAQWFFGKSLDGACPMGPWIVTADEIPDPSRLTLTLAVNGVVKQHDTTANMIFDTSALITYLSRGITLEPGDIIATGTPAGVGFARTPKEFLRPDDIMETTIDNIGALRNRVVQAPSRSGQA